MEAITLRREALRIAGIGELRIDPAAFVAWLLPILLIVYLGLHNGGFDPIERDQVGIAVWWIVLVGTLIGALPAAGGTRYGRAMLCLLLAFAAWNALSFIWTDSAEQTATEVARVFTYLGVFALALAAQGGGRWRYLLHGVTAGVVILCGIAVLSRLEPTWFPRQRTGQFVPGIGIAARLAYPLNYSSGLGALAAIGLPLALAATSSARTIVAQALAAAALPLLALTLWLTTSSLSVPAAAIALLAFFILAPDRIPKLATLAVAAGGSAILIAAEDRLHALDRGLPTAAAQHQGDELLVILLVACAGVAIVQAGMGLAVRYGKRPRLLRIPRPATAVAAVSTLVVIVIVGVAAGLPGTISDKWDNFKAQGSGSANDSRGTQILDFNGSGRYQFWESAIDANKTDPLIGIGPGTFQFWWAQHGSYAAPVVDAHSLYIETLGELGIVGLVLIGGFSIALLVIGTVRVLRAPPQTRIGIAAATAGCAAFIAVAVVDWVWELGVLPLIFFTLAAIAVAGGIEPRSPDRISSQLPRWRRYGERAVIAALSIAALLVIALPLAGAAAIQRSQEAVADGALGTALSDARQAVAVQPYAAAPRIQEALVLEDQGKLGPALDAAREATRKEATNWRNWFIRSRLEARNGDAEAALSSYRKAKSLNPRSGLFSQ